MSEYDTFKANVLHENANFLYGQNLVREALDDAEEALRLGKTDMMDLINRCMAVLDGINLPTIPIPEKPQPKITITVTMEIETITISVVKAPPPPDDDTLLRVLESKNLFAMLNLAYPNEYHVLTTEGYDKSISKSVRKALLKIHPDKCKDKRAIEATTKLNSEFTAFTADMKVYYYSKMPKPTRNPMDRRNDSYFKPQPSRNYYAPPPNYQPPPEHKPYEKYRPAYSSRTKDDQSKEDKPKKKFSAANDDDGFETTRSNGRRTFSGK